MEFSAFFIHCQVVRLQLHSSSLSKNFINIKRALGSLDSQLNNLFTISCRMTCAVSFLNAALLDTWQQSAILSKSIVCQNIKRYTYTATWGARDAIGSKHYLDLNKWQKWKWGSIDLTVLACFIFCEQCLICPNGIKPPRINQFSTALYICETRWRSNLYIFPWYD